MKHIAIPHNKPSIDTGEIEAVKRVLKSHWLIAGEEVRKFENNMKERIGKKYAVATNSGHAALHLGLLALSIREGDEVLMPAFTVSDVMNPVLYMKAKPVLIDASEQSFQMNQGKAANYISKKSKAVIIAHMLGFPAETDRLMDLRLPIIEDCAQSLGTTYKQKQTGSKGTISIFSFVTKMITTLGLGGMMLLDQKEQYEKIRNLLDYNAPTSFAIRYNYVMTDAEAAMGNVQLARLDEFIQRRKQIAGHYQQILAQKGISFSPTTTNHDANYFRFLLHCKNEKQRNALQKVLQEKNIMTKPPLKYEELPHVLLGLPDKNFPVATRLGKTLLSLPVYPELTDVEVEYISQTLNKVL